ncbi:MAG TPA: MFS transporter, partial [Candidatus Krumholzibacteria bacterium]|nr:MFS transporter [Candidatus Krumholzibacteria bacterium]
PFMFSGVGVALPTIGRELQVSGAGLGLIEGLYLGTAAVLLLPAGRLGDAGDKPSLFVLGMTVFALATLALGFVPSVAVFIALRGLQGVGAAMVTATNMAILADTVPRGRLGTAIGITTGSVYAGLSAGPFVAGIITTHLGWRYVFWLSGLMLLASTVLAAAVLPRRWSRPRLRFDWPGAVLSSAGILAVIVGAAEVGGSPRGWALVALGAALLAVFVQVERRAPSPLVDLEMLRGTPVLARALGVQYLTYAGAFGTSFLFSLHLQEAFGWTASAAGRLLMISPLLMALLAPACGRLADRVRPQLLTAWGVLAVVLGTVAAACVGPQGPLALIVGSLVLHGVGFALFSSPNMTFILNRAPRGRTTIAAALAAQMRTLGMVTSMAVITVMLALLLGTEGLGADSLPAFVRAMRLALAVIGAISLAALVGAWRDVKDAR